MARRDDERGFSLVEALVALFIMAIATVGLIRATEAHIDTIGGLETRAIALWVAENRLVELEIAGAVAEPGAESVDMLGRRWRVEVRSRATDDPDLVEVDVVVAEDGTRGPGATLRGFVDIGAAR